MKVLWTPGVIWELVGVLMTLVLTGSRKSQKNPHSVSHSRGFFALKHLPYSSAFLLLGIGFSHLALDHGFLSVTPK
jgi:hypothetical protein